MEGGKEDGGEVVVAIVGSRSFVSYERFEKIVDALIGGSGGVSVVSGGAAGTDSLARAWCEKNKVVLKEYLPRYDVHSERFAPLLRNTQIAEDAAVAIVWWDGRSKGTADVMKKFIDRGKPVLLVPTLLTKE